MREVKIRDFITKKEGYTQEFDGVDLTDTTWVFGNELPRYATTSRVFNINFNSGDNEFIQIYSRDDYIGMCDLIYYKADGAFYTVLDYNYESGGYYSLNHGEVYKTIHITGGSDVTDSSFISWLQSCATFVPKTLYTYNVEVAGFNNYGEGPKASVDVIVKPIPFTIDTEDVTITDTDGNTINEILSCGQTIIVKLNNTEKLLPTSITINGVENYSYTLHKGGVMATIEIEKIIAEEINFVFGEIVTPSVFFVYDELNNILGSYKYTSNQ